MNKKKRALDLFENPQKIKENRWIIMVGIFTYYSMQKFY